MTLTTETPHVFEYLTNTCLVVVGLSNIPLL